MLKVVKPMACKETITLARMLLHEAMAGNLRGAAVCFRLGAGPEEVVFTGTYRRGQQDAASAAGHMYFVASERARRHAER